MDAQKEFTTLITQYQKIIYKVCNLYMDSKTDRQDLFQEICLQAWKSYSTFRGEAQFSTWLYRVALNTAITFLKKDKKQIQTVYNDILPNLQNIHEDDETEEKFKAMYKAINNLNNIDKALIVLYLEDFSYIEIGESLGITPNNVAVKMNRLKLKLKEEAEKNLNQ
jgi:RNA polymerase sigma factor (sigma-70 family)